MIYKGLKQYEGFEENPFIEKAIDEINIVKKTQVIRAKNRSEVKLIVDDRTGEVEGHTAFMRFIEVEEEKFAKIYLAQLATFWDLSKPALRVFTYIMTLLKPDADSFYLIIDDCLKYTGYSQSKYINIGISDLIEAGIIAKSNNHIKYFINPLVIFNGSRVTFAKTYVKKRKDIEKGELNYQKQLSVFQEKNKNEH
jgi:hypothetical protein